MTTVSSPPSRACSHHPELAPTAAPGVSASSVRHAAFSLLMLLSLVAFPSMAMAQREAPCDPTDAICLAAAPVQVFISPASQSSSGGATSLSLSVTVQWCGRSPFVAGSDTVLLDGVRQPQFFRSS